MSIEIIGNVDKDRLFCSGSNSKLLTTFVCLSLLSEKHDLTQILGDKNFFDQVCTTPAAKDFLHLFQNTIGSQFTIHDLCSYYTGLPYTFDLAEEELEKVEAGHSFKHHSIMDEKTFLTRCKNNISQIYVDHCKFHYSEISIIFLGYIIEKIYNMPMEEIYQNHLIKKFNLKHSQFSRVRPTNVYTQDLSIIYDYPSIAILDHGYFSYSNGFYTTLSDMKIILENLVNNPIFHHMVDITHARAASNRLMNGLAVEIRLVGDDIIYGYDGLSFSGCNIWAYSTKKKQGYITFSNTEEEAFKIDYDELGYTTFDKVPDHTEKYYEHFINNYNFNMEEKDIPTEYQGNYKRVKINETELNDIFVLGNNFMLIRDPEEINYPLMYLNGRYYVQGKDKVQGAELSLYKSKTNNHYMLHDGTLYKKMHLPVIPAQAGTHF